MHAMFHLGSPDVLPVGDLGVRKGMQALYGLKVRGNGLEQRRRRHVSPLHVSVQRSPPYFTSQDFLRTSTAASCALAGAAQCGHNAPHC